MKLALFDDYRLGLVSDGELRDVTAALPAWDAEWPWVFVPRTIGRFEELRRGLQDAARAATSTPREQVRLRPPIPHPSKVLAAAANYSLHHEEMRQRAGGAGGGALAGELFLKAPSSVIGPGDTVRLPLVNAEIHYEAELAIVIGRQCHGLDDEAAMACVFGYTCLIDLTVRGKGDRSRRKSYDGFTPIGPYLVTKDEITDPHDLRLRLWRNDELRQDGSTGDMTYKIPQLVGYANRVMTLYPGDLIATGTPEGVGPVGPGDRLTIEIDRIGRMVVQIEGPPPGALAAEPPNSDEG